MKTKNKNPKRQVYFSLLLLAIALVAVTTATVAWFTIADFTKVNSMSMQITSGTNLRFDLDPHGTFDEYIKTLNFRQIADGIQGLIEVKSWIWIVEKVDAEICLEIALLLFGISFFRIGVLDGVPTHFGTQCQSV